MTGWVNSAEPIKRGMIATIIEALDGTNAIVAQNMAN